MEKIGLFDLINKFSSVANGKNEFDKKQKVSAEQKEESTSNANFTDPHLPPPQYYLMNTKMQDFCNKHESFAKNVNR